MIRRPPRSTQSRSSAASDVYKRQLEASAEKQTDEVGELVQVRSSAKSTANKILADDAEKLRELEAERNRLSARLRALAAKEARKGGGSSAGGDGGSALSRPVSGRVTSPYGMRVHPITGVYKLHDGTDFCLLYTSPSPRDGLLSR